MDAVAFFSASQDIVIDAYRIEILDPVEQGAGAAMTQVGRNSTTAIQVASWRRAIRVII